MSGHAIIWFDNLINNNIYLKWFYLWRFAKQCIILVNGLFWRILGCQKAQLVWQMSDDKTVTTVSVTCSSGTYVKLQEL